jgi:hypothetical protein
MTLVIDTNVILVANRQHAGVSEACIAACVRRLSDVIAVGRVAIDEGYRILGEYQNKTSPQVGKRPGDVFLKWLLRHNANPARCDPVALLEHAERGFESFPNDARLTRFDPPDRKFVAVAAGHRGKPPIAQAADSKWLRWAPALQDHGITVDFVCPSDLQRFDGNKKGRKKRKG